jgi:hypothetical protein
VCLEKFSYLFCQEIPLFKGTDMYVDLAQYNPASNITSNFSEEYLNIILPSFPSDNLYVRPSSGQQVK